MQYGVFIALSLLVLVLTGIVYASHRSYFIGYFGGINPLAVILVVAILGLVLLFLLVSRFQLAIYNTGDLKGLFLSSGVAIPLAAIMILVDQKAVFPIDMNVPFPESLMFYPAMGYVVEILFHVLPLSLFFLFLSPLVEEPGQARIIWVGILAISLLEPLYQAVPLVGQYATWTVAYVGLHLFVFNLFQLVVFRRYDFVAMYAFRLVYYALWHVAWGHVRLRLLF